MKKVWIFGGSFCTGYQNGAGGRDWIAQLDADVTVWACNPQSLQIQYHGQMLQLTRYEYRLLFLLIQHPEQVFSRQQLMDHIWEHPEHSLERTVDTHIKSLRQKLKQITPDDPIRTHRGFGYSLKNN